MSIYMCKDCCEPSNEIGPYDNCVNCGSHRIVEVNGFMYEGEIVIEGDPLYNEIMFSDYTDEVSFQKAMTIPDNLNMEA